MTIWAGYAVYGQNPIQKDKEATTHVTHPQWVELNGVVEHVFIDDCEFPFAASDFGLHVKVATEEHQGIYVYLGPVWATSIWTEGIEGQAVHMVVFRYGHLPKNHYIAKAMHWEGHIAEFRDNNLMPFWVDGYNQGIW